MPQQTKFPFLQVLLGELSPLPRRQLCPHQHITCSLFGLPLEVETLSFATAVQVAIPVVICHQPTEIGHHLCPFQQTVTTTVSTALTDLQIVQVRNVQYTPLTAVHVLELLKKSLLPLQLEAGLHSPSLPNLSCQQERNTF